VRQQNAGQRWPAAIPRGTSHGDAAACRAGWEAVANARLFDMGGSL
jgi:hypothetical protein